MKMEKNLLKNENKFRFTLKSWMSLFHDKQGVLPPWEHVNNDSSKKQPVFAFTEIWTVTLRKEQNFSSINKQAINI